MRPDAPWCTLCYTDLRAPVPEAAEPEAAEPEVAEPEPAAPVPVANVPEPDAAPAVAGPAWPCTTCGAANPIDRDTCAGCGAPFLAAARDSAPLLDLPLVGDITRLGRGQRIGLAAGVVVAFLLLIVLVGLLFG